MLVFEDRGKPENLEKNFSEQRSEPTTQPIYDAGPRNQTRATLVGRERSHHCTIPALLIRLFAFIFIEWPFIVDVEFWDYWTFHILKFNNASKVIIYLHPQTLLPHSWSRYQFFFHVHITALKWQNHLQNTLQ